MYSDHPFPSLADKWGKAEREMPIRLKLLRVNPETLEGKRVLDAGCGTGEYSCWYASKGARVVAVDLSESSIKEASQFARENNIENIQFLKQSVLDLEFPDESFDFVYSVGVLHHTPDPYRGFTELCRVLRPGGTLIVSVYNKFGRIRHNLKQGVVNRLAGADIDSRVRLAKKLFPRTCRTLTAGRGDAADAMLYDAFGIPHESGHSLGEILGWFQRHSIVYQGAFGPIRLRENIRALTMPEFQQFRASFSGFPVLRPVSGVLQKLAQRIPEHHDDNGNQTAPSWISRGMIQTIWFILGFRFSIFSLSGRKRE